ncbi:DUF2239 family protein [Burkholderia pseudomultivorans]|uniref:DUF2239 domain-containing protein n=1 Tax=Burkholderia pseudomultivorans TaxID=1207504 RepID=A0ABU2EBR4_9BURK|nr:DUF2239 family protein [Burkholderia pseudomultivorans]MDR8731986.1 hypothetical protein [Burkholderia pseudomultivorans]MDR8736532.1 hypothetical protein [Burkholderia pseudomultivorans]MDR8745330.1 hypothetical protein [Burkholderia pseudomultivorans]MDR8757325.1 hypothetical protein [Burkholderia pseudomultivorans]MDR8779314.1 hypothetical protein [Burkholderia pseudomultivorans]
MTSSTLVPSCTAFDGHRRLASGPPATVALAVKRVAGDGMAGTVLIFDDATGRSIDLDLRGTVDEVRARYAPPPDDADAAGIAVDPAVASEQRGRGRPKLGVVSREVTLLPRHWEWLAAQPGGASVALRKLVEDARRTHAAADRRRDAQARAYHFMSALAGDLPGFEEAARMLYANDLVRMAELIAGWPDDVRDHALALARGDLPCYTEDR